MSIRLDDVPIYESKIIEIPSKYFNRIRLGQIRLQGPLRLELAGLRDIDVILEDNAWICIENSLSDLPVLAWTDFEVDKRNSLNEPVRCKLCLYNIHADLITETALKTIYELIDYRLQE